jgi:hypothetical protein
MRFTSNKKKEHRAIKMNVIKILMDLEEYTKYFDLCYWKERSINPESPDLDNWTTKKRSQFQEFYLGGNNDLC